MTSSAVDHAAFIRTVRRLLPLDEQGTREWNSFAHNNGTTSYLVPKV